MEEERAEKEQTEWAEDQERGERENVSSSEGPRCWAIVGKVRFQLALSTDFEVLACSVC